MAVFMIAAGIFFGYEGMKWASMKLTVCENAVYGSYGIGINKQFKLTWDEIVSVSGGRNSVNVIVIMVKAKS